jgi:hypothetical protein
MAVGGDAIRRDAGNRLGADRKNALAAARSRCSLSMTSTSEPSRSIARYKYRQCRRQLGLPIPHTSLGILRPVEHTIAAFVELLRAVQTTEPAIALCGAFRPLLTAADRHFAQRTLLYPSLNARDRSHYIWGTSNRLPDR